ncbi:WD40 repeat-like protein [Polyporus arcularius HHB13444]|uniref:WD40 repeat-like protein n=1 Tax=Polyporus arcularius HHB13444 TaxID=1314778 RepID=A0A5C3PHH6_9APHY|nr:WD40 repeat-like protein [Polyporus arcularius HHB13444]
MSTTPWDIYAEQLLPVGYGHPLWIPEPNEREVEIGDVGWLNNGEFRALFNSMKPHDDPINLDKGVPPDFKVFNPRNLSIHNTERIGQKMVCSRSINAADAQGHVGAGTMAAPVSAGAGIKFQSMTDSGAFVLLEPPAQSKDIESKRHIVNYMRDNLESWLEFANAVYSWGLDLREQDIIFVCGTTKTTRWAVAAFHGTSFRKKEGYVTGDFGPFASAGLSINISNQILPAEHYRHGPRQPRSMAPGVPSLTYPGYSTPSPPHPPNQCLFVHYYKMKRRAFWWPLKEPMRAAGGPHQLPPGPDNPEMDPPIRMPSPEYEFESEQAEGYDPVNALLDYILSQSVETEVAIASDLDLYAIFVDNEFPNANDMPAVLEELRPTIEVDERGVGTISADYRAARKRRNEDLLEEGEQTHKRARSTGEFPYGDPSSSSPVPHAPQDEDAPMWETIPQIPGTTPYPQGGPGAMDDDGDVDLGAPPGEKAADKRPEFGTQASGHDGSVTALTYSADGSFAASGSEDTYIIIWDVHRGTAPKRLEGHQDTVSALAFSRDNRVLASASQDERIILWDVARGAKIQEIVPDTAVHSLVYTPDGTKLVAGASDGKLHVWNSATYELERTIEKNTAVVTFIVFSKDGQRMATGGTESVCYIWETSQLDAENPQTLSVLDGHRGMVCAAAFSPDGNRVVTASDDGSSRIWKAETGEALVILHEHTGPVWSVAFSPDGKRVASGSSDSTVKVCDSYSGERILSLDGHDSMINAVEFSPDGQWIASAASDNTVRLWTASDGVCTTTFNEHNDNVTSVMFSPDGLMLASGSHDGTVRIRPVSGPYHVEA